MCTRNRFDTQLKRMHYPLTPTLDLFALNSPSTSMQFQINIKNDSFGLFELLVNAERRKNEIEKEAFFSSSLFGGKVRRVLEYSSTWHGIKSHIKRTRWTLDTHSTHLGPLIDSRLSRPMKMAFTFLWKKLNLVKFKKVFSLRGEMNSIHLFSIHESVQFSFSPSSRQSRSRSGRQMIIFYAKTTAVVFPRCTQGTIMCVWQQVYTVHTVHLGRLQWHAKTSTWASSNDVIINLVSLPLGNCLRAALVEEGRGKGTRRGKNKKDRQQDVVNFWTSCLLQFQPLNLVAQAFSSNTYILSTAMSQLCRPTTVFPSPSAVLI